MTPTGKIVRWILLGLCLLAARQAKASEPNVVDCNVLVPGQEIHVKVSDKHICGGGFQIYLPTDYDASRPWPVIFYYHGAGEKPSTQLLQKATRSKGFIIVAMDFCDIPQNPIKLEQYMAYIHREQRSIGYARACIEKCLNIDQNKLLLAGVSKGGWLAADIAETKPTPWAGVAIFCAGRHPSLFPVPPMKIRGKNIYIGAGQTDQNLEPAQSAAEEYRRAKAKVVLDIYPGLGHAVDPNSTTLHQWLNDVVKDPKTK